MTKLLADPVIIGAAAAGRRAVPVLAVAAASGTYRRNYG